MLQHLRRYGEIRRRAAARLRWILSPIPPAAATIAAAQDRVWRRKCSACTTLPKGVSVLSSSRFISGVKRPGTYQLSASDSTIAPQCNRTRRWRTASAGPTPNSRRCSGDGGVSAPFILAATMRGGEARRWYGAPTLEGGGGAIVAQQIGIERLKQGERLDARNEASRPSARAHSSRVVRAHRRHQQHHAAGANHLVHAQAHRQRMLCGAPAPGSYSKISPLSTDFPVSARMNAQ